MTFDPEDEDVNWDDDEFDDEWDVREEAMEMQEEQFDEWDSVDQDVEPLLPL